MENLTNNMTNLPEERGWEYKQITVTRVPGYGFGIAVSGGRDNPHFASGDPSIAVSDVLDSGPAERTLQVNDRIISVNGISLQNVDYATAVQVLRDSGDTVVLVVKRRTSSHQHQHQHSLQHQHQHSLSASYTSPPPVGIGIGATAAGIQPAKITLTKNSKKEDFGIVLGCKLFIKEISSKARDQLLATNQYLVEGDFITKVNNTNCNDIMSLKEAKKIIDNCKDKLNLTIARDISNNATISHQTQSSVSTTGAVNNYYKGDDYMMNQSYSNQNLYVQPPTRNPNLNTSNGFMEEKAEPVPNPAMLDDKSNLVPRGRLRGPLSDANLSQLDRDRANSMGGYGKSKRPDEPPRPPPPRAEDYYSSRRQLYEEDPLIQKAKQSIPDARFITFQKEGSVGIRLTGGNYVGIFVTAVQPGSPASLQGLQPGDKILKVNDMDMTGVTREEAVLFLLSLQDRIELIVQFCKEEYDNIVASQKGDSFYIKTHFHYDNPAKGEMSFRSGDTFHVVDTLYNGVVGCWQVYRVGRNNQQLQKGIIPNKARAEELATAQFNATKKEMSTNESRGSFFRRRRSSNRRSKSLGKEHWDDILFSDCVSKFPAYERVVLKHPGFTRPVILFGPIADIARDKMLKDFPDKFISPQLETGTDEPKAQKSSNIIRLSAIRDVISTGKHALLDITPNAVERLNYAQLYPIVIFFKAESKIIVKQLRQGLPKSAHKSSKKLLEQCQKLDKVWNHIFSATVTLNDNTENWYRKVRELIDKQQTGALWMSEAKPEESLSDDFLFPMSSLRLSYASSPESDLEHSPGPPVSLGATTSGSGNIPGSVGGRLAKASSDPSVVMPADSNTDTLPPYQPTYDTRYGFSSQNAEPHSNNISPDGSNHNHNGKDAMFMSQNQLHLPPDGANINDSSGNMYKGNHYGQNISSSQEYHKGDNHKRQSSNIHGHYSSKSHNLNDNSPLRNSKEGLYGTAPDLPPRVDRTAKPASLSKAATTTSTRSAHERLFGTKASATSETNNENQNSNNESINNNKHSSLERRQNSKSDSLSSYDSFNIPNSALKQRLGPNAHDDLKSSIPKVDAPEQLTPTKYSGIGAGNGNGGRWDQAPPSARHNHDHASRHGGISANNVSDHNSDNMSPRHSREVDKTAEIMTLDQLSSRLPGDNRNHDMYNRYNRSPSKVPPPKHVETKTDYGKYSRNNSSSQDYSRHSHQDLTQAHLSIHQSAPAYHHSPMKSSSGMYPHSNGMDGHVPGMNGPPNTYKPVPPPKPKNYKPPFKNQSGYGANDTGNSLGPPNGGYQHGKSHSNPVNDQRNANYYYNMPTSNDWHTETAIRYSSNMHGHYDMSPSGGNNGPNPPPHPGNGNYEQRRHTSISYSSRNEAMMHMTSPDIPPYGRIDHAPGEPIMDTRPNIVDLQGSREQRGSAFELYRKPVHHNMSLMESTETNITGSQSHSQSHLSISSTNNSDNAAISSTMSLLDNDTPTNTKQNNMPANVNNVVTNGDDADDNDNIEEIQEAQQHHIENSRDVTSAILDHRGGVLVNEYWGVSLEVPQNALPVGIEQEIYFVITDPRTCENAPPLDLENGETMLSPLVMCGPQGIEFLKPVILNIPHYANTLPSMAISLKATDSEKDIHTDWDNILLPSNHAANSVAVKVDHF